MKRLWTALLAAVLLVPLLFQTQAQAAVNISVLIDGVRLNTPQAPIMIQGRVMLPMRSIFEALDASVKWNQKTQTVTATKDGTTVILKINAKTATINNQTVSLDVPAKNLKGYTMVPVRFVSEALGQKIGWNSKTKTVTVTTVDQNVGISPVSYVTLRDVGNAGDGRDLQVSFSKSVTESLISHYRVVIVKQSKSLNLSQAQRLSSANYTAVYPTGGDLTQTLSSTTRDSDNELIRDNQAYKAYVLAVGKSGGDFALSAASPSLTLTNTNAVNGATNVKASDVSDFGDGRDLSVSFTRAQNESNITNYRVFVVKTKDIANFNLAAARAVPSQNYTTVNKTSNSNTTLTTALSSSARDTGNETIRNGVAYTVFVLAVSNNENAVASNLSSASASITLSSGTATVPIITQVADVSDYNDGRDLRVSFNKVGNESNIHSYRIFVVKDSNYHNFDLNRANGISSYNYTQVNKTGNNINNYTLPSGARDVDGAAIRNGVYYRVFVMAVYNGNQSYNVLSAPSNSIILTSSYSVGAVTNLYVNDVANNNDGRDLQVSFNRPSDHTNISAYRVFVVKSSDAYYFDLNRANGIGSTNYTQFTKNNDVTFTRTLNSGSRDVNGDLIRNNTDYQVFVMSVANNNSGNNALSYGASIRLTGTQIVQPVSGLSAQDTADYGDGRDLRVTFNRTTDEYYLTHYRVFVVKNNKSIDINEANRNSNYTIVNKSGSVLTQNLAYNAKDTDGHDIVNGVNYRVYVLSVGNSYSGSTNALSSPSANVVLTGMTAVDKAYNVRGLFIGNDLKVTFNKANNETNIKEYRIFAVPKNASQDFKIDLANTLTSDKYFIVTPTGQNLLEGLITGGSRDSSGTLISNQNEYYIYILSVHQNDHTGNSLSEPSPLVQFIDTSVTAPSSVYAGFENGSSDIIVRFTTAKAGEYRIMAVPSNETNFNLAAANTVTDPTRYIKVNTTNTQQVEQTFNTTSLDTKGNAIAVNQSYNIYVLAVSSGGANELSSAAPVTVPNPGQTTGVTSKLEQGNVEVAFNKAPDSSVTAYRVFFVAKEDASKFNFEKASKAAADEKLTVSSSDRSITRTGKGNNTFTKTFEIPTKDANDKEIVEKKEYAVFVLSLKNKSQAQKNRSAAPAYEAVALSSPSEVYVVLKPETIPTTPTN